EEVGKVARPAVPGSPVRDVAHREVGGGPLQGGRGVRHQPTFEGLQGGAGPPPELSPRRPTGAVRLPAKDRPGHRTLLRNRSAGEGGSPRRASPLTQGASELGVMREGSRRRQTGCARLRTGDIYPQFRDERGHTGHTNSVHTRGCSGGPASGAKWGHV